MQALRILSGGIVGTSFMTLFSYILSIVKQKDFREPATLSQLLRRLQPQVDKKVADIACWNVHYAVGVFFTAIYHQLWKNGKLKPGIKESLLLGAVTGVFAIGIWHTVFSLHPDPPQKDFKRYYGQLFTAHLIFGLFAWLGYKNFPSVRSASRHANGRVLVRSGYQASDYGEQYSKQEGYQPSRH